jgi:fructose-specific phosphotransferase system IIA component
MVKDLLKEELIFNKIVVTSKTKSEAINIISMLCAEKENIDENKLRDKFMEREALSTTGFGEHIAIPHAKIDGLKAPFISIIRFQDGIEWEALDDEVVKVAIALVMPNNDESNLHLKIISKFARKLMNGSFVENLLKDNSSSELYKYIIDEMGDE